MAIAGMRDWYGFLDQRDVPSDRRRN
jgi:hypothetical protein